MSNINQKIIKRIVIKIGTSSLTHDNGRLNYRHIEEMVDVICDLNKMGHEIVIVTSGAIGVGVGKVNLLKRPNETEKKRAMAAVGQSSLMGIYEEFFKVYHCTIAQVLLTKSVFEDDANYDYADIVKSFSTMFEHKVIPIVNENDVVSSSINGTKNKFGDNDTLSAYVARFIKADLLLIWSDIDGLYDKNPRVHKDARIISIVTDVNDDVYEMAGAAGTSRGSGGMITKLNAADIVMRAGINMVIANSFYPENLYNILENKNTGTLFQAMRRP